MRLKTLSLKGFKSFANETSIHFEEDVIGIVGPNGSGKSNIVDAIRWVLGEQKSRELRLDQMSSVIFNGTKKKRQSGMAQVSLTFENTKNLLPTEYHSVTISRILYRSGESEYRLNDVPCRLKDITSLFLDTGIGSNSYAIIALGMVDDILADKENARRRMFEQAAGISKYKVRKRETLNKLKNTTADLERIEDLLFEIESNLKTLEKQAKRTKKYFELKEKYKTLSVDLGTLKASRIKERQKSVQQKLQHEELQFQQCDTDLRKLEAAIEKEKKANLDKEKNLSDKQRDLNHIVGIIRGKENDKRMLEQQKSFNEQTLQQLKLQMQQAKAKSEALEGEIDNYRARLQEDKLLERTLEDALDLAEKALENIRENHGSLKANLDEIVTEQQQLERSNFELEKKRAVNSNQIQNFQQEIKRDQETLTFRNDEIGALREQLEAKQKEEDVHFTELQALQQKEQDRQEKVKNLEEQINGVNKKVQLVNRRLDAQKNEYQLTQSMIENLEGFPESIKFLNQHKDWDKETPVLSDLLYVSEEYRVAIENYLDPYLNYYVVPNFQAAHDAIKLLNQAQKGKANFFLLDAFKDYSPPMTALPNTLRAVDLVEVDPGYYNLVSYLLENVLISDREELRDHMENSQLVILSRSGRFIQKKFSLSGGSVGLFEGKKIGRKKNLEILEKNIQKTEKEANQLSTKFYSLQDQLENVKKQELQQSINELTKQVNQIAQEKVSLSTKLENFESLIGESSIKQAALKLQIQELQSQNQEIEKSLQENNARISTVKESISNTDGRYRDIAEQLSGASADFNAKNIEFIKQQNKVNTLQRELAFRERQQEEAQSNFQQSQRKNQEVLDELDQNNQTVVELTEALHAAYQEKKVKEANLSDAEQSYFQARGGINELDDEIRKVNKRRNDLQLIINELKDKFNTLKFEMTALGDRLNVEFGIHINELINQEPKEGLVEEELQQQVVRLKHRLDNYGEINPMAVEAYDEMKERYDSILTQKTDIEAAKEDLLETIKEIEETATSQFTEAFEKARLYFIDVFRSLFTADDNCDLILLDPENPLDSKIEIVAKPKGKRPQTISQLSGGEKTLTATALLFALYLLKPAPFCIFDEVDAPLDDANIEKFNRIIKKFSKDSQFIIVTHNKQTMAAVDIIYGVFMQEAGVSTVNQVDFRNFEHTSLLEASSN